LPAQILAWGSLESEEIGLGGGGRKEAAAGLYRWKW
jgi:hypothetical protein